MESHAYHFVQVMCSDCDGRWSGFIAAVSLLLMLMPDHIVGVFFYVVARKTEAERHVWLMVDRDGVLAQNGLGGDLLTRCRWEVMHVKV
jgi:hypothetical protein